MAPLRSGALALSLGLASCSATQYRQAPRDLFPDFQRGRDVVAQGWLGLSSLESDDFGRGADLPVIGGAFQQPLFGGEANVGVEGGVSFEWDGDVESFAAGGGGLVIVTDNDLFLGDLFGGPYAEIVIARRFRFYGAAGWTLQYARCDAEIHDPSSGNIPVIDDDFGGGIYARTGFEVVLPSGASLGFGFRYVDTSIDFGDLLGTYELERIQWLFTLTRNI